jgi:two-component system nitrate/nitrite response regulator NarL
MINAASVSEKNTSKNIRAYRNSVYFREGRMDMGGSEASNPIGNRRLSTGSPSRPGRADDTPGLSPLLPRLYVISETRLFREGLIAMMIREGRLEVIGHGTGEQALAEVGNLAPDLALLDMAGHDCLVIPRQLHAILPSLRIVAVAVAELETDIIACAEAGICGYVSQSATVEDLLGVLLRALTGEVICSPRVAALLFDRLATLASASRPSPAAGQLTRRERQIAGLIARGLQNKEIARRLCLSHATAKNHVHNILQKLNMQRRNEIFGRHFDIDAWRDGEPAAPDRALPNFHLR